MNHLIECVKKYPELYNPNHVDFKVQRKKANLWATIAYELALEDGETARSKWRNLRDSYVKYLRNSTIHGKTGNRRYKNWPWAKQMEFVRPFIGSKWPEQPEPYNTDPLNEEGGITVAHEEGPPKLKRKRCTESPIPSTSQNLEGYLSDYYLHQDSDADDLLFLSYSKTLRTFNKQRQMMVKSKIAKVMLKAEMHQTEEDGQMEVKFEPAEIYVEDKDDDEEVINVESGPSFFVLDKDDDFAETTQK